MSEWVFADLAQTQHNIQAASASDVCSVVNDGFTITMGAEIMRAIVRQVTDGIGICAYGRSAYDFWAISVDATKSQWPQNQSPISGYNLLAMRGALMFILVEALWVSIVSSILAWANWYCSLHAYGVPSKGNSPLSMIVDRFCVTEQIRFQSRSSQSRVRRVGGKEGGMGHAWAWIRESLCLKGRPLQSTLRRAEIASGSSRETSFITQEIQLPIYLAEWFIFHEWCKDATRARVKIA